MKMKPKVTMATASLLQLVLLSAITSVEFHPLNGYSSGIPNKMRESSMVHCEDYTNISKWFDLQDAAAKSLLSHYVHMEEALGYLTAPKASTNCCFYDKDIMNSIMENINKVEQQNGVNGSKTLSPSGEMRIDLNKIVPRIKNLVTMGFENCCSQIEVSLKNFKKNFNQQLGSVKHKFKSEASDEFSMDRKELEEKHQNLRNKIKDSKERLNNFESKKMESGYQNSCCAELNIKTEALEKQIEVVSTESLNKTNQIEIQLKDIGNLLNALRKRTKGAKSILESQGEIIEEELENCETEFKKLTKTPNKNHNCCEACLVKLVDRLKELEERSTSLINSMESKNENNKDGNSCLENDKRIVKIKELTDKSEVLEFGNNSLMQIISTLANKRLRGSIKELALKLQDLKQATNKSQICCKNIDKISTFAEHLQNKIEEIEPIYLELFKQNKTEFEGLKNQAKETLTKLYNIKNNDNDLERLQNLQVVLSKVKSELKVQEDEVNELLNQKNRDDLMRDFEKLAQELDQFWSDVDVQLSQLEGQNNALDLLLEQAKDLSQSLEAKLSLKDLKKEESQYQIEQEKLKELNNQVGVCLNACSEVPKLHDLIKNVNNIMQGIRNKKKPEVERSSNFSHIFQIPKKVRG